MKLDQIAGLSNDRLELLADDLYRRLQRLEAQRTEPIAIVGMACRFPGAPDVQAYWKLLADGIDAIREVPPERTWDKSIYYDPNPDAPGKSYVWEGGFLDRVEWFDAKFFGISAREVKAMDPQQRLLLEMVWQALEHGAQAPSRLVGSATGLYVAISTNDFLQLGCRHGSVTDLNPYSGTGTAASIAAGRISYLLGFHGPCFPVDTACSSSLVALHLACQSLRLGEIDTGIVAGVNLMLAPETTVYFCKVRALSFDGRCHTFDAAANGYVRSEGAGAVVLKRLSDAVGDRDNILAVIRGTAVNHDGRTSGLTVPNGGSQERLIRQALASAGLSPGDVSYVEAHGTGTPLGDPIELQALGKVFEQSHGPNRPLWIGSCKTNIGHAEAAAGLAGLIKLVLSLQHRRIPAHLHFRRPNPAVPWQKLPFEIPGETMAWNAPGPRRAGVSSFGFSGTNAHAILEEAPEPVRAASAMPPRNLLCVTAKTREALRDAATELATCLGDVPAEPGDVCFSSAAGRSHFAHRLALPIVDAADGRRQLESYLAGKSSSAEVQPASAPNVAFLFTGQGAQYVDMGRELFDVQPAFRAALLECEAALSPHLDRPLRSFLFADAGANEALLKQTQYAQPGLFAVEYALGRMWMNWGVRPAILFGHSIGQYAAACLAEVFSLADAAELVACRSRLMQNAPGSGTMLALRTDVATAAALVAPYRDRAGIGAVNAPQGVVVSGCRAALDAVAEACRQRRIACQELVVSHAFHSPLMEPIVAEFRDRAAHTPMRPPRIGMVSDADGKLVSERMTEPDYWSRQLVEPVQFVAGMQTLRDRGYEIFVEIGPAPTLTTLGRQTIDDPATRWLPSLRPRTGEWDRVLETLRELYLAGVEVDWEAFYRDTPARRTTLPTYPFQRQRYVGVSEAEIEARKGRSAAESSVRRTVIEETPSGTNDSSSDTEKAADWVFDVAWKSLPPSNEDGRDLPRGSWLILGDAAGVGAAAARLLEQRGDRVYFVEAAAVETCRKVAADRWQIDPARGEHYRELLSALATDDQVCRGIFHLWSADSNSLRQGSDLLEAQRLGCQSLFHLVKALATGTTPGSPELLVATRGAEAALSDEAIAAPEQGPVWGLAKVIAVEYPQLRTVRIDFAAGVNDPDADAAALLRVRAAPDYEDQTAVRGGCRYVARLRPRRDAFTETPPYVFKPDATYLITGGLGGLGLALCKWMIDRGARRLVLSGRSQPDEQTLAALEELRRSGADVQIMCGDVAVAADLTRILQEIRDRLPPLAGIIHAAGVLADGPLTKLEWSDFETVLRPKLLGTWELHQQTRDLPLDFLVGFSSIASLLGSPHQGNYAAANAGMDSLLAWRSGQGKPGLSLNWGPWSESGMAARMGKQHLRSWSALGIGTVDTESGCRLMDRLATAAGGQLGVIPTDWVRFFQLFPPGLEPPLLKDLVRDHRRTEPPSEHWEQMLATLAASPVADRQAVVGDYVEALVAEAMGDAGSTIDRRAGLFDLGVDSLIAIQLRTRIQTDVGFAQILPVTMVFNLPTIDQLASWLLQNVLTRRLESAAATKPASPPSDPEPMTAESMTQPTEIDVPLAESPTVEPARKTSPPIRSGIAVVGIGCRYPGGIDSPESFWRVLAEGIDCIREVPATRWDIDAWYDPDPEATGKLNTRYGGFIDDVDRFDAAYFGISPREAVRMDPQHRLLLETTVHALEHANQDIRALAGRDVGVFIGLSGNDYLGVLRAAEDPSLVDGWLATGNALSIAAGRLSHYFDFTGPCLAVDTACSSSLLAVHLACEALLTGKTSLALAGGVGLILGPEVTVTLTKAHAMAPDGRCKTFDAAANGYVRSEGCGLVVLKRLEDAQAAGDRILGVIRGTAMNHDGHSSGVTVPNGGAQTKLLQSAVAAAGVSPAEVGYIEAHGTGTPLGDPIELQAVGNVYGPGRTAERPLYVGSVKTNLGHTEAAAGVAGLIKCLLALQHQRIPPNLHFRQPNPFIPWSDLPVEIPRTMLPWPATRPRLTAVSSFGFSGTNVHVVLQEAERADARGGSPPSGRQLLCLTAKCEAALGERARQWVDLLERRGDEWADLCYTVAAGRTQYDHRLTVQAESPQQMQAALKAFLRDEPTPHVETATIGGGKRAPRVALLFSDDVHAPPPILREMYSRYAVCRTAFHEFDAALQQHGCESCLDLVLADPATGRQRSDGLAIRAANLAMQFALAELWKSWGVEARAVYGSGAAEYVAAHWAGVFPLDEAVARAVRYLRHGNEKTSGTNGVHTSSALLSTAKPTHHGNGSHHEIGLLSGVSGTWTTPAETRLPDYWSRHRDPRSLERGLETLQAGKFDIVLELGASSSGVAAAGPLRLTVVEPGRSAESSLLHALGVLQLRGVPIRWKNVYRGRGRRWVELPDYPFQRERYWPDVKSTAPATAAPGRAAAALPAADSHDHPVLGRLLKSPVLREEVYERQYSAASPDFVKDHHVHSLIVLPGASHLSMALSAAARASAAPWVLEDVAFPEAMILGEAETRTVQVIVDPKEKAEARQFRVLSQSPDNPEKWLLHCGGKIRSGDEVPVIPSQAPDVGEIQQRCTGALGGADHFYRVMEQSRVSLGPSFQWNKDFWLRDGEGLSRLIQPDGVFDVDQYSLFPGLIDSCIQLIALAIPEKKRDNAAYIPVAVQSLRCYAKPSSSLWCHFVLPPEGNDRDGVFLSDWTLFDDDGRVVAEARGMRFQRAPRTALLAFARRRFREWLYRLEWVPQMMPAEAARPQTDNRPVLILTAGADDAGAASALLSAAETNGVVAVGCNELPADYAECLRTTLPTGASAWGQIVFLALGADQPDAAFEDHPRLRDLLALVQALMKKPGTTVPRLTIVTRLTQPVGVITDELRLDEAPLWGFARVLAMEFPQLRCRRLDLEQGSSPEQQAEIVLSELRSDDVEDQLAYRDGVRYVARLLRGPAVGQSSAKLGRQPYRLQYSDRGVLEDLTYRPTNRVSPALGEIEIAVQATGLNFRDVLTVLNLYPGLKVPLGVECAGFVAAVGSGVTGFAVGDRVAAIGPNSFNEFIITDARMAVKLPDHMSFVAGATIPVVFLTAEYALRQLAGLQPGETLLVHSAAGGVGHAAIQIAKRIGARVIATAGNPQKREYVREQGIEHVFDSRSLEFADDILRVTEGRGVDVVLNFLPGDAIAANLRALARHGRFVEIGKIDIWDEKRMAEARPDVRYHVLALDELALNQPGVIEEVFGPLMAEFAAGTYHGLPATEFDFESIRDAFRYMAQGLHIGKVVIKHVQRDRDDLVALQDVYANRTWLVTGGLGALGLHCVRQLVALGARDVVILSRSRPSEQVQQILDELRTGSVQILVRPVDVCDYDALETLLREIDAEHLPLGGVLHLAGVVDDGMIVNLDWTRFEKVLRPKVLGAWNLHRLTRDRDLHAFVLFSSAASLIGSLGQANYAAANAFLDALAFSRRAAGLSGLSINWGPWSEGGMASRAAETAQSQWKLMGLSPLNPDDGLQVLQLLLDEQATQAAVLPMDWKKVLGRYPPGTEPPVLSSLAGEQRAAVEPSQEWLRLVEQLKEAPPAERVDVLMSHIQKEARTVLGMDPSQKLDPHTPLNELGFDSLTAVELSNRFTNASGISLSLTLLFDYPTLHAMSTYLVRDVLKLDIGAPVVERPRSPERDTSPGGVEELTATLLESIGQMSEEDVQERVKQLRERS